MIEFRQLSLAECGQAGDICVVIDVLRAFSTEAVAFDRGAREIIAVGTVEEAMALKERDPSVLVMGEVNGYRVNGFDLWNSPTELVDKDLSGLRLVHRTTAGTQGILCCSSSRVVLVASFLVAGATARYLSALAPDRVDFIITGRDPDRDGNEDSACADYLTALLEGQQPDPESYLQTARKSDTGHRFLHEKPAQAWLDDLSFCMQIDRYNFAMRVTQEKEGWFVRQVSEKDI